MRFAKLRYGKKLTAAAAAIMVFAASLSPVFAGEGGQGTTIYQNTTDLAGGATYTNMVSENSSGRQESYSFTSTLGDVTRPIVLACDTIYGTMNIDSIVSYAQQLGYNVVAAMNSDFFSMATGVPLGIVVEDGIYKCSPEGYNSVVFDDQGHASVVSNTAVQITMTNQGGGSGSNAGKNLTLTHFNKMRQNGAGLYLFDEHFSTVSTRTSSSGWAVKFKILEGEMKTKGAMTLQVTEVYEGSSPMTIGEGYMVLTADDTSNLYWQFQKFSVGDTVKLETSCWGNTVLENAVWATGAGDILVQNGQITSSSGWDSALAARNPRSALGIKADGTVVYYEIDGRQSGYSGGLTMTQLAQEMIDRGCVTVVNFDGGGSSAVAAKLPGSSSVEVLTSPSDGALRKCATYILLVAEAVSDGRPDTLALDQAGTVIYQGASMDLSYKALDQSGATVTAPSDVTASVTGGYGTVSGNTYTAGWASGMTTISMNSASTGASGDSSVYVVNRLSSVTVKVNGQEVSGLNLEKGDQVQFSQTATYDGKNVVIGQNSFVYTLTGDDIGTISDTGLLTVSEDASGTATLTIASGGVVKTVTITVDGAFSDITGHWAESYITEMYEQGIVTGVDADHFRPGENIKRADFMLMLYRASGSPALTDDSGFADVPDSAYYADAVKWAKTQGIAQGDGTNFYPTESMTREDAFTFLYRYLTETGTALTEGTEETLAAFSDADLISDYARESTAAFVASGIVDGYSGAINPQGLLTRAEMCKILSIGLNLQG